MHIRAAACQNIANPDAKVETVIQCATTPALHGTASCPGARQHGQHGGTNVEKTTAMEFAPCPGIHCASTFRASAHRQRTVATSSRAVD